MELLSLKLQVSTVDPSVEVVLLEGSLDVNSVRDFEATMRELFQKGKFKIILNLGKLSYVSSAGYWSLLNVIKEARENHGDIKILQVNPGLSHTFSLLDAHSNFGVLQDEVEAVESFD